MITAKMLMITVLEASKTTRFPIRKWIQWILRGLIPSEPELNAEHIKGIPYASIAPSVFIPVTALPKYYREAYLKKTLVADPLFSVDFIGYLDSNGSSASSRLLNELSVIKQFVQLQQSPYSGKTKKLRAFAVENGYSLATLYRKEDLFMHSDLRKMIKPSNHIYQPRDMCNLSKDYSTFEWSKPNHLAKVLIQKNWKKKQKSGVRAFATGALIILNPETTANSRIDIRSVLSPVTGSEAV